MLSHHPSVVWSPLQYRERIRVSKIHDAKSFLGTHPPPPLYVHITTFWIEYEDANGTYTSEQSGNE